MKLFELSGIKQFRDLKAVEAVARLKREFASGRTKLRFLGHGESAVALTDGTSVFKLWYKDSAYEKFVECALENQDNPFFPKFKSAPKTLPKLIKITNQPGDIRYVKMELLEPYTLSTFIELFTDKDILDEIGAQDKARNRLSFHILFDVANEGGSADEMFKKAIKVHCRNEGIKVDLMAYKDSINPELRKFIEALALIEAKMGDNDEFDYGRKNMAQRGNQPVILDPVCNAMDNNISAAVLKLDFIPRA